TPFAVGSDRPRRLADRLDGLLERGGRAAGQAAAGDRVVVDRLDGAVLDLEAADAAAGREELARPGVPVQEEDFLVADLHERVVLGVGDGRAVGRLAAELADGQPVTLLDPGAADVVEHLDRVVGLQDAVDRGRRRRGRRGRRAGLALRPAVG